MPQVSPCIAAPDPQWFCQIRANTDKTEKFPRLPPQHTAGLGHARTLSLTTTESNKGFQNSTPPFVRRGKAGVAMAMRLLLRLICADHL